MTPDNLKRWADSRFNKDVMIMENGAAFDLIRASLITREKIKPFEIIKDVEAPTLFIAGEKDPTVCPWHTEKLYKEALCTKKFELFDSIHAEDLYLDEPEKFVNTCVNWLKSPSHNLHNQTSEDISFPSHQ